MPGTGEITYYDDTFRRQSGNDHAHPAAEVLSHSFESLCGPVVALIGTVQQVGKAQAAVRRAGFHVVAQGRAVGSEYLPATAAAAPAEGARGIHRNVPELPGHPVETAHQRPVGQNSGADTFGNGDHHQVAACVNAVEPDLGQDAGIGSVLQFHVKASLLHDWVPNVDVGPFQIGSEHQAIHVVVEAAGQTDAHPLNHLAAAGTLDPLDGLDQPAQRQLGIRRGAHHFLRRELAVGVAHPLGGGPSAWRGSGWPTSRCSRPTDRSSSSVLGLLYRPGRRPGRPHHACTCPCREPHRDSHFETALLGWTLWLRAPTVSFTKRAFFASLANSGGAAAWISGARTPRRSAVESTRTRLHDTCATGSCPLHWSTPTGTGCRGARPMFGGS